MWVKNAWSYTDWSYADWLYEQNWGILKKYANNFFQKKDFILRVELERSLELFGIKLKKWKDFES